MGNKEKQIIELTLEIERLKEELAEENQNPSSMVLALLNYLDEIHSYLLNKKLSRTCLEMYSFGIFRLVTDDYHLEISPIGQSLLKISVKLRELE